MAKAKIDRDLFKAFPSSSSRKGILAGLSSGKY